MEGDDRARFCGQCRKHVFNLSVMTCAEAEALIREKEGRLCGRFYRRRDGRVLTADCSVGVERRRGRLAGLCGLLFATTVLTICSRITLRSQQQPIAGRSRIFAQVDDWIYEARIKLGLIKPPVAMPQATLGRICVSPSSTPLQLAPPLLPPFKLPDPPPSLGSFPPQAAGPPTTPAQRGVAR